MKLKNKKTGDICEVLGDSISVNVLRNREDITGYYSSLAELNAEWEDYEEPKSSYYLTAWGEVKEYSKEGFNINHKLEIGNYFETKEEAEKAVEKLKALKRLKDKGFKFIGVRTLGKVIDFDIPAPYNLVGFHKYERSKDEKEFYDDLLLLFGGE